MESAPLRDKSQVRVQKNDQKRDSDDAEIICWSMGEVREHHSLCVQCKPVCVSMSVNTSRAAPPSLDDIICDQSGHVSQQPEAPSSCLSIRVDSVWEAKVLIQPVTQARRNKSTGTWACLSLMLRSRAAGRAAVRLMLTDEPARWSYTLGDESPSDFAVGSGQKRRWGRHKEFKLGCFWFVFLGLFLLFFDEKKPQTSLTKDVSPSLLFPLHTQDLYMFHNAAIGPCGVDAAPRIKMTVTMHAALNYLLLLLISLAWRVINQDIPGAITSAALMTTGVL